MELKLAGVFRRRGEGGAADGQPKAGPSGLEARLRRRFARRVGGRFAAACLLLVAWGYLARPGAAWLYGVERRGREVEAQATAADQDLQRLFALAQDAAAPPVPPALVQLDPAPVGGADPFVGGAIAPPAASVAVAPLPAAPQVAAQPRGEAAGPVAPRPPAVEFVGLGVGGGRSFAVLAWAGGQTRVVQVGELVDGWRVAAVDAQTVTLTHEAHRTVLKRRGE